MWTRNYKNLIQTKVSCANGGYNGVSSNAYGGDDYWFNYKAVDGTIREICTNNAYVDYGGLITKATFIYRNKAQANTFTASCALATATQLTSGGGNIYIALGSENTPEDEQDYTLGNMITNLTSHTSVATAIYNNDGTFTVNYKLVISSNSSADITISEVGLFLVAFYNQMTSNSANRDLMLINRIVLDNPVIIAANQTATVTFSVTTPKISFS